MTTKSFLKPNFEIFLNEKFILIFLFLFSFILRILLKPDCFFHADAISFSEDLKSIASQGEQGEIKEGVINSLIILGLHILLNPFNFVLEDIIIIDSILMASFSVVLLYLFVKRLTNNIFVSFISAFLFSLSPIFFSVSTSGMYHSTSAFFVILTAYFILIASQKDSIWLYILSGIFYGTAIGVRITNVLFIFPFILIYFLNQKKEKISKIKFKKKDIINLSTIFVVSLVIAFVFYYKVFESGIFFNEFLFELEYNKYILSPNLILFSLKLLSKNFVYWGWIIFILGVSFLVKKNKNILIILLTWWLSYFLYFGMVVTTKPSLYTIASIPLWIIIAYGFLFLSHLEINKLKFKKISIVILIILIINMLFIIYPILKFRHDYCGPKEMALFFKENTEPNAIIFTEIFNRHVRFYGHRKNEVFSGLTNFQQEIDIATSNNKPIYVTETFLGFPGNEIATHILKNEYDLILIGKVSSENFNSASIRSRKFIEKLYRLEKKN